MEVSLLGKMKLYELAKELNLTSKELLDRAGEIGLELKSHLSTLEDDQIEKLKKNVSSIKSDKKPAPKKGKLEIICKDIENELKKVLGTKVTLNAATKSRGKIVIEYFTAEELDRILEILGVEM